MIAVAWMMGLAVAFTVGLAATAVALERPIPPAAAVVPVVLTPFMSGGGELVAQVLFVSSAVVTWSAWLVAATLGRTEAGRWGRSASLLVAYLVGIPCLTRFLPVTDALLIALPFVPAIWLVSRKEPHGRAAMRTSAAAGLALGAVVLTVDVGVRWPSPAPGPTVLMSPVYGPELLIVGVAILLVAGATQWTTPWRVVQAVWALGVVAVGAWVMVDGSRPHPLDRVLGDARSTLPAKVLDTHVFDPRTFPCVGDVDGRRVVPGTDRLCPPTSSTLWLVPAGTPWSDVSRHIRGIDGLAVRHWDPPWPRRWHVGAELVHEGDFHGLGTIRSDGPDGLVLPDGTHVSITDLEAVSEAVGALDTFAVALDADGEWPIEWVVGLCAAVRPRSRCAVPFAGTSLP